MTRLLCTDAKSRSVLRRRTAARWLLDTRNRKQRNVTGPILDCGLWCRDLTQPTNFTVASLIEMRSSKLRYARNWPYHRWYGPERQVLQLGSTRDPSGKPEITPLQVSRYVRPLRSEYSASQYAAHSILLKVREAVSTSRIWSDPSNRVQPIRDLASPSPEDRVERRAKKET
jgi:hypothetical protein